MLNPQQNNVQDEIEQIKKEINLLQDRQKKNGKSQIKKIQVKKGQSLDFSQTKKIQNIVKNRANQEEHKSTTKYTCTSKKKNDIL